MRGKPELEFYPLLESPEESNLINLAIIMFLGLVFLRPILACLSYSAEEEFIWVIEFPSSRLLSQKELIK